MKKRHPWFNADNSKPHSYGVAGARKIDCALNELDERREMDFIFIESPEPEHVLDMKALPEYERQCDFFAQSTENFGTGRTQVPRWKV
jgi:hypothetical protein